LTQTCQGLEPSFEQPGPGRRWTIHPLHLCLAVLQVFLRGWHYQRDVWRVLLTEPLGPFAPRAVEDEAVYQRLAKGASVMHACFAQVSAALFARLDGWCERTLAPFATDILVIDESKLDQVKRWLPALRGLKPGSAQLLPGRISALFDLRRQQWVRVDLLPEANRNCKLHARALLHGVRAGSLLLFDSGYLSFEWFDWLAEASLWWISRYANKVSYQLLHTWYEGDGVLDAVVYLGAYRADQARYPVRMVRFWHQGRLHCYLTNVLDPHRLSLQDIVRLYARRWDIETALRVLKQYLHVGILWSAKWEVIQVQLWAALLLAHLFHALQMDVAQAAGVEPFEVSIALLIKLTPGVLARGQSPLATFVRSGRELQVIRPSHRLHPDVPFVDPLWLAAPPQEGFVPREQARHSHRKCGPRPKQAAKQT
jgi:hypothetical protein